MSILLDRSRVAETVVHVAIPLDLEILDSGARRARITQLDGLYVLWEATYDPETRGQPYVARRAQQEQSAAA